MVDPLCFGHSTWLIMWTPPSAHLIGLGEAALKGWNTSLIAELS